MKKHWNLHLGLVVLIVFSTNIIANNKHNIMGKKIGVPGDEHSVERVIKITAIENMFLPSFIDVNQGEVIRFIFKNGGSKKHEMIIDTMENLKKHAKMRRNKPNIIDTGLNQIQLEPGERKELIWEFTNSGVVNFACPLPGHFKKMRGQINVNAM